MLAPTSTVIRAFAGFWMQPRVDVRLLKGYCIRERDCSGIQVLEREDTGVDDQLVLRVFTKAILEKDQASWHVIWNVFHPVIARKLKRELSGWIQTSEEIRDVTQMVFIKFWEDSQKWTSIHCLYTSGHDEGVLSRLHSTAVYTVQRYRQTLVRKWIPLIRDNYSLCSQPERKLLQDLARDGLSRKYKDVFLLHLREYPNTTIASLMQMELRDVSVQINRAWERFVYVLLQHRQRDPSFDMLFQRLLHQKAGV